MIFHQSHNSLGHYNYNAFFYTDTVWEPHFHKNFELIYVMKGSVVCTVNNKTYTLSDGDFGLCLPYDIHCYHPGNHTLYWVLVFSEDYIRYLSNRFSGKKGDGFCFRCKSPIEEYAKAQLIQNPSPTILTLKSCLYAVLEEYLQNIHLVEFKSKQSRQMSFITEYIAQNHTSKLTLSDIAEQIGYDYNYMSRYFRNTFNMSFSDFVNIYRTETAVKLLEETDKSITAVAFESGFQSVRSFNSFFKKTTKMSPCEYRKAFRE